MVCLSVRKVGSCLRTELCAPSTLRGPRPCTLIVDEDQPIVLMRLVNGPVLFPAPPRHKYNSDHITRGDGPSASYPTIRRLFMKVCLLHQQATDNAFRFRLRFIAYVYTIFHASIPRRRCAWAGRRVRFDSVR